MKRFFLFLALIVLFHEISFSQIEGVTGKPIAEIFTDFHLDLVKNSANNTGFGLNRAYFGYNFAIDKNFFAVIILNIASPDDLPKGSKARRYAFFREASMNYSNEKLTVTMGLVKTKLYIFQQNWWGMRYISKTFQDLNCYGTDSDLGLAVTYKFSEMLEADLSLLNGKGGGSLQLDNNLKSSAGLTLKPSENTLFRLYDDVMKNNGVWENTSLLFAGYRSDRFFLGSEFNFKTNLDTINGHNAWGISATGGINITEKWMLFSRYDLSRSLIPTGSYFNWNYKKDGSLLISGLQYSFTKMIRVALNYQASFYDDPSRSASHMIFLNLVMKI